MSRPARGELLVVDDPAAEVAGRIGAAVAAGSHIALTGGSTPRIAYEKAATMDLDFSSATFWFGDDRCVPPDHEHSNYGMAKRALFDRIEGAPPTVHRIEGELGPDQGAAAYERALRETFPGDEPPQLDLILLGLGPDAHCASLFPGNPELGEEERWSVGVNTPGMAPLVSRVSLTFPVLNAGREVVFLVTGEDKAPAVRRAFGGPPGPDAPGSLVDPASGSLTLVMDAAAAAGLEGS
jgi:6-phosphogluconolactonase